MRHAGLDTGLHSETENGVRRDDGWDEEEG